MNLLRYIFGLFGEDSMEDTISEMEDGDDRLVWCLERRTGNSKPFEGAPVAATLFSNGGPNSDPSEHRIELDWDASIAMRDGVYDVHLIDNVILFCDKGDPFIAFGSKLDVQFNPSIAVTDGSLNELIRQAGLHTTTGGYAATAVVTTV